ncbi:MAG: hypothetical protein QOI55_3113 [Actinomycetota bacterium]|nr:hypothetical protein [Actinomycetota bacterium]
MQTGRRRVALIVTVVAGVLVIALAMAEFVACGNGNDKSAPTTFTAPHDTKAAQPTTPPPTLPPTTVGQLPREVFPPRPWRTGFNGVLSTLLDDAALARDTAAMAATGARWLRADFYWAIIQGGGPESYDWTSADRVVQAATSRGMEVLALAAYSPEWARPPGTSDHHPPLDPDAYAKFLYQAAKRYAPLGVHAWEIWNEPNVDTFWQPRPDPASYAAMLQRAYVALKSADPKAVVITGGLAPGLDTSDGKTLSAHTFLSRVYDAGAGGSFDAVGLHPYSFPAMPLDAKDWNTFYNAPTLYQVMVDHGDAKKRIWGTEYGASTSGPGSVSDAFQSDVVRDGYRVWLSWPFTGPLLIYVYRDYANNPSDREANFGLVQHDGTPKPAFATFEAIVRDLEVRQRPR